MPATKRRKLRYSAFTAAMDGTTFTIVATVKGAERKAIAYARRAFPAWGYLGYGPTIVVEDAQTGERLVERRL